MAGALFLGSLLLSLLLRRDSSVVISLLLMNRPSDKSLNSQFSCNGPGVHASQVHLHPEVQWREESCRFFLNSWLGSLGIGHDLQNLAGNFAGYMSSEVFFFFFWLCRCTIWGGWVHSSEEGVHTFPLFPFIKRWLVLVWDLRHPCFSRASWKWSFDHKDSQAPFLCPIPGSSELHPLPWYSCTALEYFCNFLTALCTWGLRQMGSEAIEHSPVPWERLSEASQGLCCVF